MIQQGPRETTEDGVTGYLMMDLSSSMAYTFRQELTKFEYGICLAVALGYLMIYQQDPVGCSPWTRNSRETILSGLACSIVSAR